MPPAGDPIKFFGLPLRHAIANGLILFILLSAGLMIGLLVVTEILDACITESRGKILNVSGYDFEFRETSCDLIAKDDAVSVLASRTGDKKQTSIFKYVPGRALIPTIESTGEHSVKISIPDITEEFFRNETFQDLSIQYDVGEILYPGKTNNVGN